MKRNVKKAMVIMAVLLVISAVSGILFILSKADTIHTEQSFERLREIAAEAESEASVKEESTEAKDIDPAWQEAYAKYSGLYEKNPDFVGWISIAGTDIDYPVMQRVTDPEYYLHHAFDGTYSNYGVPCMDEKCLAGVSNNVIIYGHHMKDGTMFADLSGYTSEKFAKDHPLIRFDTLDGLAEYVVAVVFRIDVQNDTFRFNDFTDMDADEFAEFVKEAEARQIYDTGIELAAGDTLLTLVTCEYQHEDGRLVVVARKLVD